MSNEQESWENYRAAIAERLDERRPARCAMGEKDWREPVYGWARNHIPNESTLVRVFAEAEVDRVEGKATRRGNKYLRQWAKGQRPLLWADLGPLPVVVGKVRIRLDAVTADDIEDAAMELEAAGKVTYDEVVLLGRAMRDLARNTRRQGLAFVALLGDLGPRHMDDGWSSYSGENPDEDLDEDDDDEP